MELDHQGQQTGQLAGTVERYGLAMADMKIILNRHAQALGELGLGVRGCQPLVASMAAMEDLVDCLRQQSEGLHAELSSARAAQHDLSAERDSAAGERDSLRSARDALQHKVSELENSLAEVVSQAHDLRTQLASAQEELSAARTEVAVMEKLQERDRELQDKVGYFEVPLISSPTFFLEPPVVALAMYCMEDEAASSHALVF